MRIRGFSQKKLLLLLVNNLSRSFSIERSLSTKQISKMEFHPNSRHEKKVDPKFPRNEIRKGVRNSIYTSKTGGGHRCSAGKKGESCAFCILKGQKYTGVGICGLGFFFVNIQQIEVSSYRLFNCAEGYHCV